MRLLGGALLICLLTAISGCATEEQVAALNYKMDRKFSNINYWARSADQRFGQLGSKLDSLDWDVSGIRNEQNGQLNYGFLAYQQYEVMQNETYISQYSTDITLDEVKKLVLEGKKEILQVVSRSNKSDSDRLQSEIMRIEQEIKSVIDSQMTHYKDLKGRLVQLDEVSHVEVIAKSESGNAFAVNYLQIELREGESVNEFMGRWGNSLRALKLEVNTAEVQ